MSMESACSWHELWKNAYCNGDSHFSIAISKTIGMRDLFFLVKKKIDKFFFTNLKIEQLLYFECIKTCKYTAITELIDIVMYM